MYAVKQSEARFYNKNMRFYDEIYSNGIYKLY
jgi:hypothetical protein